MFNFWKLKRTKQCAKCPWRVSTNPHEIPDGYSVDDHKDLACTIAPPKGPTTVEEVRAVLGEQYVMSCHEHNTSEEVYCIGWLHQQITIGNNVAMRIKMLFCKNAGDLQVIGDQHAMFEDTLPPRS